MPNLDEARDLFREGRHADVIAMCEELLLNQPQGGELMGLLGMSCIALGRKSEGLSRLRAAAANDPRNPEHAINLAMALSHCGEHAGAIQLLDSVITEHGPKPALLFNLGSLHQISKDDVRAIEAYRQCLTQAPRFAQAHNNLGVLLEKAGTLDEAIACYRRAIAADPRYVRALNNLGNALRKERQWSASAQALEAALALVPDYPSALCNQAQLLLDQERTDEAAISFRKAIAAQPGLIEAVYGLGKCLHHAGEHREALPLLERVIGSMPGHAEALSLRAQILLALDEPGAALSSIDRALAVRSSWADAWNLRGLALARLGEFELATDSYQRALQLAPDYVSAQWNLALARLTLGDFRYGWPLFESRLRDPGMNEAPAHAALSPWRGEAALAGRTILVWAEYGLGDTLQFCRYVNSLAALGAQVILEAPAPLHALLSTLQSRPRLSAPGEEIPADVECPLLSLPLALSAQMNAIPAGPAYLRANPALVECWAQRLSHLGSPRVGIAWQGNPLAERGILKGRSIALRHFEALLEIKDLALVALQKGAGAEELGEVGFASRITSFGDEFDHGGQAFADTAAIMMNVDLIVTVDTSIAHLAGALGVPVWVMLHRHCDWRWGVEREDSPWYPSMRLFRQPASGEWRPVVDRVCRELRSLSLRVGRKADPATAPVRVS